MELREKAAKAIKEAMQKGGKYKIFFVITLEGGRVRPADVATMRMVLDACPDIGFNQYSVIVNKLNPKIVPMLEKKENAQKIATSIFSTLKTKSARLSFAPFREDLDYTDNAAWTVHPKVKEFIDDAPWVTVLKENVEE